MKNIFHTLESQINFNQTSFCMAKVIVTLNIASSIAKQKKKN